jgi:elongation factor P--beta-lysine ligase
VKQACAARRCEVDAHAVSACRFASNSYARGVSVCNLFKERRNREEEQKKKNRKNRKKKKKKKRKEKDSGSLRTHQKPRCFFVPTQTQSADPEFHRTLKIKENTKN